MSGGERIHINLSALLLVHCHTLPGPHLTLPHSYSPAQHEFAIVLKTDR